MGDSPIAIISAPKANEDQLVSLITAIKAEGKLPFPVYVTRAELTPITKGTILDWTETMIKICTEQGWAKELRDRMK